MNKSLNRLFLHLTAGVLSLLTAGSILIWWETARMQGCLSCAMIRYHSVPYMTEHILCGMVLYLAFSVAIAKICPGALYDGESSCKK